jgi:peptide/nickel transport system permease protein
MQQYLIRRFMQAIPILVGISFISFLIVILAPGDTLSALYPEYLLNKIDQDKVRAELGLDQPVPVQYLNMMNKLITGNLDSFLEKRPVVEMIAERVPPTFIIGTLTLILSILISIPIALFSATHRESWIDSIIDVISLMGISLPSFLFGLIMLLLFSERWHLLPSSGIRPITARGYNLFEMGRYLVMPVAMLSLSLLPGLMRYARAGMIEVMREDYIRTARAKGVRERIIIYKHALRNALLPFVAQIGLLVPFMLGGTAITETIFGIPGLGRLTVNAAFDRDYPVILTLNLYFAALTILSGILTDIAYSILDPRIRQG